MISSISYPQKWLLLGKKYAISFEFQTNLTLFLNHYLGTDDGNAYPLPCRQIQVILIFQ